MDYCTILKIIQSFYQKANFDIMIGYHFRVIENFEEHIPRIADFWNLQLNQKLQSKEHLPFNLLKVHNSLGIKKGEIGRWVKLFEDNLEDFVRSNEISVDDKQAWLKKVELFREKIENFILP